MLADDLGQTFDEDRRVGQAIAQHVRPDHRQFATAGHVRSPVVCALDFPRRNMRQHKVDDLAIMVLASRSAHSFMIVEKAARKHLGDTVDEDG